MISCIVNRFYVMTLGMLRRSSVLLRIDLIYISASPMYVYSTNQIAAIFDIEYAHLEVSILGN